VMSYRETATMFVDGDLIFEVKKRFSTVAAASGEGYILERMELPCTYNSLVFTPFLSLIDSRFSSTPSLPLNDNTKSDWAAELQEIWYCKGLNQRF
jgi:hypothetical protein